MATAAVVAAVAVSPLSCHRSNQSELLPSPALRLGSWINSIASRVAQFEGREKTCDYPSRPLSAATCTTGSLFTPAVRTQTQEALFLDYRRNWEGFLAAETRGMSA